MGFSITALAQKARTQTLIVDSDLNMGQYDITATDVKGDTAEFDEFVGGVGNFSSGIVSGKFDVGGILHAESNLQVDGGISLEGSLNNVNITQNGDITTVGTFYGKNINDTGVYITANTNNNNIGVVYATCEQQTIAMPSTATTMTISGYTLESLPLKISSGVYANNVIDNTNLLTTRTIYVKSNTSNPSSTLYIKPHDSDTYTTYSFNNSGRRVNVDTNTVYDYYVTNPGGGIYANGHLESGRVYIS